MAKSFKKLLKGEPKPKEFVNNPKLIKALKTQKKNINRNLSRSQQGSYTYQDSGRVTESQVSGFYSSTNWG